MAAMRTRPRQRRGSTNESGCGGAAALDGTHHRVERHHASVKVGMMSVKGRISSAKPMAAMLFDWKRALSNPAFVRETVGRGGGG